MPKIEKTNIKRSSNGTKTFDGYKTKNHDLTVILTPILMIFYSYTPRPYKNVMNKFDLQFKIFTLVDMTKSYFILNGSIILTLSVCLIYRFDAICILPNFFQRSNHQTCVYIL